MQGVAVLRGLAHDVKTIPDQTALRGPDDSGDPYGGLLRRERGLLHRERGFLQGKGGMLQRQGVLLQGEACGFVFRHSVLSGQSRGDSLNSVFQVE